MYLVAYMDMTWYDEAFDRVGWQRLFDGGYTMNVDSIWYVARSEYTCYKF